MSGSNRRNSGFSLVEISISAGVLVVVLALVMSGLLYMLSSASQSQVQAKLDVDVQAAMERLKQDIRLTSLDDVVYYPAGSNDFTAMSFPAPRVGSSGIVNLDTNGAIVWDKRIVYHVWATQPYQLRRTIFAFSPSLTAAQLQAQLNSVVVTGNGSATYGSTNASTEVVFENLFDWTISPLQSRYDGFVDDSGVSRVASVRLGACVVQPGLNSLLFKVIAKNPACRGGCAIGLDSLTATPSYSVREAENLPATVGASSPALVNVYASGGWSGEYYRYFPATATGQYFTLSVYNDQWQESRFGGMGYDCDNTKIEFDPSLSPKDYVVRLNGNTNAWAAADQSGDTNGVAPSTVDAMNNCAVRVLVKGANMAGGNFIGLNGVRCKVWFETVDPVTYRLRVEEAWIGECANAFSPSPDVVPGSLRRLTFGGANGATFPLSLTNNWCDMTNFTISVDKTYVVSFLIANGVGMANPWLWRDQFNSQTTNAYVRPHPPSEFTTQSVWSTDNQVTATNVIPAVRWLFTRYPTNGYYTSPSFDTHLEAPAYASLSWTGDVPAGCSTLMRVRTATNEDMTGATSWSNVTTVLTTSGPLTPSPGSGRYVQFQAELRSASPTYSTTPTLQDVLLQWPGESRIVDLSASVVKGTNFGVAGVWVNSNAVEDGLHIDLTIFDDVRSFGKTVRVTSSLGSMVRPRNTGR